jgi:hypothetical protein
MSRRAATTLLTIAFAAFAARAARSATAAERAPVAGVVFAAQPVRTPVLPDAVSAEAPFVPSSASETTGTIGLGPERAAAFWLDPLDVVRVRSLAGGAGGLHFARVLGGGHARARVDEPGVPAGDGITWLAQPPGRGDVWIVWAERPARVRVERPVRRPGRMIWEHAQAALLAWIDHGGDFPTLPLGEGTRAFALRVRAEERLGHELIAAFPAASLERAVRAWRQASALAGFLTLRPLAAAFFRTTPVDDDLAGLGATVELEGAGDDVGPPYRRLDGPSRQWTVSLQGPGVLRVEARALFSGQVLATAPPEVALAVSSGGVLLGRRAMQAQPAMAPDDRDPPPAFPRRVPLRSGAGDYLGERVIVTVPLYPGRNDYQLEVAGGPLALRVTAARRRPRVGEALGGASDTGSFVADARAALAGDDSPGARVVGRLLDELDGSAPGSVDARTLPPLLSLYLLASGDQPEDVARAVRALPAASASELVWTLVLRAARRLYGRHEYVPMRALLHAAPGLPPSPLLPELVQLLPPPTPLERLRSQPVAALDVAWREDPMDPAIAQGYRAAWRGSTWALVPPQRDDGEAAPARPASWLVEAGEPSSSPTHAEEPPRLYEPGALWHLPLGTRVRVSAPPSLVDPSRAALLTVFVETPAAHVGPITLRVDGKAFHTLGVDALERLELAVAPGVHELRLDAPAGTDAWSGLPPAEGTIAAVDTARLRHYWPLADAGKPVRYPLPGADLPGPVQISLRAGAGAGAASANRPIHVTLHADVGAATALTLWPGAADPLAHAADAPSAVGDEITIVVRPPAGARTLWLDADTSSPVYASLSVRRDRSPPPSADAAAPPAPPTAAGVLGKVAALSHALAKNPRDAAALVRRAELLLDLGQADLARQDLLRLVGLPAPAQDAWLAAAEDELIARLDAWSTPSHIVLAEATKQPVPVSPALLVLAPSADALAPYAPAVATARAQGASAGLAAFARLAPGTSDPVALYLAARLRAESGDAAGAGLALLALHQASGRWQVGLEALDDLAAALADPAHAPPGTAALAFGLAQRLRSDVDHPRLRRALLVAASLSRWDSLDGTESNAGQEHVFSNAAAEPPTPLAATREALLATPWPARQAHTVSAGNGAALELTVSAPTTVAAQVFCLEVKVGTPAGEPCALSVRVDDGKKQARSVRVGVASDLPVATLAPGRHVVEVLLDDDSEGHLASVRFVSERALPGGLSAAEEHGRFPIKLQRRQTGYVASTTDPVAVTLVGPAALWVQARALDPGGAARNLVVTAVPRRAGRTVSATIPLPALLDDDAHGDPGRALALSTTTDVYVVLPDAVPYAVTVAPSRGKLVTRLSLREDKAGKPPRTPGPWWLAAASTPGLFALPALPPPLASIDGELWEGGSPGRLGTFSVTLGVDQESRDEEDTLPPQVLARAQLQDDWRLAVLPHRLWLHAGGVIRWREETSLVAGGSADVRLGDLPLGLFAELGGSYLHQSLAEGGASNLDVGASLGRAFRLSENLTLTPRAGVRQTWLTLPMNVPAGEQLDPEVWNGYRADHLRRASARVQLAWLPFQDLFGGLGADATTNDDLVSLDHASVFVQERMLLPLPLLPETLVALDYRPTYRFADRDRPEAFLRHDLSARLEWSLWTGDAGRFVLSLWDDLFLSPGLATRNVFGASLRFDLTRGRGLTDFRPEEGLFDELVESREWAASPPDGP